MPTWRTWCASYSAQVDAASGNNNSTKINKIPQSNLDVSAVMPASVRLTRSETLWNFSAWSRVCFCSSALVCILSVHSIKVIHRPYPGEISGAISYLKTVFSLASAVALLAVLTRHVPWPLPEICKDDTQRFTANVSAALHSFSFLPTAYI